MSQVYALQSVEIGGFTVPYVQSISYGDKIAIFCLFIDEPKVIFPLQKSSINETLIVLKPPNLE